jgi:hypothetical protein
MSPVCKERLSGAAKLAAVVLVVSLGIWGCARRPDNGSQGDRIRSLEGKCVKREQDYLTVSKALDKAQRALKRVQEEASRLQREAAEKESLLKERDELRKLAQDVQVERDRLTRTLAQRTSEREELQQQLSLRTSERDSVAGRLERVRRGLQSLMAQDELPPESGTTTGHNAGPASPVLNGQS